MKFELEPDNRGADDETLLSDLRDVATALGKDFVTREEYEKRGRWSSATFINRLGSWSKAHKLAGLRVIKNYASGEDCLKELRRVAEKLGVSTLGRKQYKFHGTISSDTIIDRFGSWKAALERVGLESYHPYTKGVSDEELFENLEQLWESLGRQPRAGDFVKPLSRFSRQVYHAHFGTLRKALEAFVASFENAAPAAEVECSSNEIPVSRDASLEKMHRTSRNISWRTRFLVMRRDSFRCCICGVSPATKPAVVLVVDHVIPWAMGGETVMENLQTLCEPCNGGKSDLPMREE